MTRVANPANPPGARLDVDGGTWRLSGRLDRGSVPALWDQGLEALDGAPSIRVDLSAVERSDSAGLALLVGWLREARRRGVDLGMREVPAQLAAIVAAAGLDRLFGTGGGAR